MDTELDTNSQAVAAELSKLLTDENVLYVKTKNTHRNVMGEDFYDKHKFFEMQFGVLDKIIDSVAERMCVIGYYAPATFKGYLSFTDQKNEGKQR
jgi:starvation-inducible DNA-binding protein